MFKWPRQSPIGIVTQYYCLFVLGLLLSQVYSKDNEDQINRNAIHSIHAHLDDNHDGEVDFNESSEFIRDELQAKDGKTRHSNFHGEDNTISEDELWHSWRKSEVHNWTNKEVVEWIVESVCLPQYKDSFSKSGINGSMLPGLATPQSAVFQQLGIIDKTHRRKISLRAIDVVLFGPPITSLDKKEKLNFQAIAQIHQHLDYDNSGDVDLKESHGFIHDQLHAKDDSKRQSHFHGSDDKISVEELWITWRKSEVHNWTGRQVIDWLTDCVHLPQYSDRFEKLEFDGTMLPRLAAPGNPFLQHELVVRDAKHRKKIALRAMDTVLFGPPLMGHNFIKDIVLAVSVLLATVCCWAAFTQKKKAKRQMEDMTKDIEALQQAETNLQELQEKLLKSEQEQCKAIEEKRKLEAKLKREVEVAKREAQDQLSGSRGTEEEMMKLRDKLEKAEYELMTKCWQAPPELKHWLQVSYDKETEHFKQKRLAALQQLVEAKEACERLKKKRSSLMGSFRLAHDLSINEVDGKIVTARASLAEVTKELEERQHRWSEIENLCCIQVMTQNGVSGQQTQSELPPSYSSAVLDSSG